MKNLRVPIIFHPPTYEEYKAEEVASEILSNAFGACKIDIPETTCSIDEVVKILELFELDIASFKKRYNLIWEPNIFPKSPTHTGTLVINIF